MAEFTFSLHSKALIKDTMVTVILPVWNEYEDFLAPDEKFQTLWLLHGNGENFQQYTTRTDIYRLANNSKLAVVLPDTGGNHYNDVPGGPAYYTYVSEELPRLLRKHLPLSEKREDNFIFGHSMGGYGAFKCAMDHPENYSVVGVMSSGPQNALQLRSLSFGMETPGYDRYARIFGGSDRIPKSINDPWYMMDKALKEGKKLPLIFDCCGTNDPLYPAYKAFLAYAEKLNVPVTTWEAPGGHSWDFWTRGLDKFFEWLPLLKHRDYIRKVETDSGLYVDFPEELQQKKIKACTDTYYAKL